MGLNKHDRPSQRLLVLEADYMPRPSKDLDLLPYRFLSALAEPFGVDFSG